MRRELLRATMREPKEVARGLVDESRAVVIGIRDVLRRAEREEFRVRIHPRDIKIGRASCRERVEIREVDEAKKRKKGKREEMERRTDAKEERREVERT